MVAPRAHVLNNAEFLGSNIQLLSELMDKIDGKPFKESFQFAGGTMFWVRPEVLKPLYDLKIKLQDFDEEAGQIDGTLAHALERILGYIVTETQSKKIVEI